MASSKIGRRLADLEGKVAQRQARQTGPSRLLPKLEIMAQKMQVPPHRQDASPMEMISWLLHRCGPAGVPAGLAALRGMAELRQQGGDDLPARAYEAIYKVANDQGI